VKRKKPIWATAETHAELMRLQAGRPDESLGNILHGLLFDNRPVQSAVPDVETLTAAREEGRANAVAEAIRDLNESLQDGSPFTEEEAKLGHAILSKVSSLGSALRGADIAILVGRRSFWNLLTKFRTLGTDLQKERMEREAREAEQKSPFRRPAA
tara:strand:+ start:166 stop:633 length:468 start_codon:yes stop_codon:yes gene_type:complete